MLRLLEGLSVEGESEQRELFFNTVQAVLLEKNPELLVDEHALEQIGDFLDAHGRKSSSTKEGNDWFADAGAHAYLQSVYMQAKAAELKQYLEVLNQSEQKKAA